MIFGHGCLTDLKIGACMFTELQDYKVRYAAGANT